MSKRLLDIPSTYCCTSCPTILMGYTNSNNSTFFVQNYLKHKGYWLLFHIVLDLRDDVYIICEAAQVKLFLKKLGIRGLHRRLCVHRFFHSAIIFSRIFSENHSRLSKATYLHSSTSPFHLDASQIAQRKRTNTPHTEHREPMLTLDINNRFKID